MRTKLFAVLALMTLCTACGTTVVENVVPVHRESASGAAQRVVVMPFSDYTTDDSLYDYWFRNVLVNEALSDELIRYGFGSVVYEDVIAYLLEKGFIKEAVQEWPRSVDMEVLERELAKEWSPGMKAELFRALYLNHAQKSAQSSRKGRGYWEDEKRMVLDTKAVREMGRFFAADYVFRGRIVVLKAGQEDSFNPFQTGLLPFLFKVGQRTVFGVAQSDTYELIDKMAIGGLLGAAIAPDNWPLKDDDKKLTGHPRFGGQMVSEEDFAEWNAAIWGATGAGLAFLAHKGGRVDSVVVQLRVIAQDVRTGYIVWSNRAEVKVTPKTFFGDKGLDTLTSEAIRHAAGRLMDNFVASLTGREVIRSRVDGSFYVTAAGGTLAPEKTRYGTIFVGPPIPPPPEKVQLGDT